MPTPTLLAMLSDDSTGSACHPPARVAWAGSLWRPLSRPGAWFVSLGLVAGSLRLAAGEPIAPSAKNLGDLSLEQLMEIPVALVSSASKYEQKTTRAPATVSIATADEIAAFGHRTLADVLRSLRGLYVSNDSNYSYLGMRGFLRPGDYNTRVLVLIDGHRMNDNIYDAAFFGHENMLDVDAIDRVEVVRGPSSSVYGSNAFLGVVNVVTKRGHQLDGTEVSGEVGSLGTQTSRISYGKRFGNAAELFLSANYFHSTGQKQIYYPEFDPRISANPEAANRGIAQNADAERASGFTGNLKLGDFTFAAFWSARMKQVPTASFSTTFNDGRERTRDYRSYLDVQYAHDFAANLHLEGRAFWDLYSYYGDYPFRDRANALLIERDKLRGEWVGTEWHLAAKVADRHVLVAGAEYRENLHQHQSNYYDATPPLHLFDDDRRSHTAALYAHGEFSLRRNLLLNAGVRYDRYSNSFGGTLNPRLGLIFNPAEKTTLKLLHGRAFRAPNAYERFFYPPPKTLMPERIRTTELALEHDFASHYRLTVSAYRYDVSALISQAAGPGGAFYFANLDSTATRGLEFELEAKYATGVRFRTSYALQRSEDGATHAELTNSPRHLGRLGVICPFSQERFTAGFELQSQSSAGTLTGGRAAGFTIANVTLAAHRLRPGVEVSASVYNLFDTAYASPGAEDHVQDVLPQPGRTLRLKLAFKF